MAYELKDNSGSIFPNNRKESQNHADWQGSIKIDGKEYWIYGKVREPQNAQVF